MQTKTWAVAVSTDDIFEVIQEELTEEAGFEALITRTLADWMAYEASVAA
jgi:hypothetical protein